MTRVTGALTCMSRSLSRAGGRACLVERGLEQHGYDALQALVADYVHEPNAATNRRSSSNLDQLMRGL